MKEYDRRAREIREQLRREKVYSRIKAVLLILFVVGAIGFGLWQYAQLWDHGCRPYLWTKIWVCPK